MRVRRVEPSRPVHPVRRRRPGDPPLPWPKRRKKGKGHEPGKGENIDREA